MSQDTVISPVLGIAEVTAQHRDMFEAVRGALTQMVLKQVLAGNGDPDLFGLIVEADDQIWRGYIKPEGGIFLGAPRIEYAGTLKLYGGVTRRKDILHIINQLFSFKERLSRLPGIGFVHVLVLGAGMASSYTLYWGRHLVLDWA